MKTEWKNLWRVVLCLFLVGTTTSMVAGKDAKPNIIVALVDDMGWSDLGCYGGEISTPNLDGLAKNGLRFTQFYNTARCSPTRASLMTGLYPHQAGMGYLDSLAREGSRGFQGKLSDECVTIAEVLKQTGYFTIMTGKWHMGQHRGTPPWDRGFDRSLNAQAGGIYFPNQGGRRAEESLYLNGRALPLTSPELGKDWYSNYLWTEFGLKFIDEAQKAGQPFFYYLAFCAPHFPLMAPQEDIMRYKGKYMAGWDKLREERYQRQIKMGLIDSKWPLSPRPPDSPAWDSLSRSEQERFDHIMAIYAAMVDTMDRSIGNLVAGLKERGLLDNTLILFMSDNGGNAESGPDSRTEGSPWGGPDSNVYLGMNFATLNNTPFRRYKHFTHEGGISTPLIAHWPEGINSSLRGSLVSDPGHVVDIMSTCAEVGGASYPATYKGKAILPAEGVSLAAAFSGQAVKRSNPIFWEHEGNRAVRVGKWKLVSKHLEDWELFDLEADRTEQVNLAGKHPEKVKELLAAYEGYANRAYVEPWPGPRRTNWGQVPPKSKKE